MEKYTHFGLRERRLVARKFNVDRLSYEVIATHLGVAKSAVWNEVKRNKVRVTGKVRRLGHVQGRPVRIIDDGYMYDAVYAQQQAEKRAEKGRKIVADKKRRLQMGGVLYHTVDGMLRQGIKPDPIAGRLKVLHPDDPSMWVSHETIYQHAYTVQGCNWGEYFVKERKKRRPHSKRRSQIPDRVSIKHRPAEAKDRQTVGHWEGDTVVGFAGNPSKHVVATLVERSTRKMCARISADKSTANTIEVISDLIEAMPGCVKTVTFDNGTEFASHKLLTTRHNVDVYFADPYSSWQRGTNERHNGLLRRFFPKGTDFGMVTAEELEEVVNFWNNYPRKILGYLTPNEAWTLAYELAA